MFAVPGWKLSSAPVTQTQLLDKTTGVNPTSEKKRKRADKKSKSATGSNSEPVVPRPKAEKSRKKQKTESEQREEWAEAASGADEGEFNGSSDPQKDPKQATNGDKTMIDEDDATSGKSRKRRERRKKYKKDKSDGEDAAPASILRDEGEHEDNHIKPAETAIAPKPTKTIPHAPPAAMPTKLTPLQSKMASKLTSARFRHLNETLYTTPSAASSSLFMSSPELFDSYHEGFRQQVSTWPQNPIDDFVQAIRTRGAVKPPARGRGPKLPPSETTGGTARPLPRDRAGFCTIADLGCGDAALVKTLRTQSSKLGIHIHSFDLISRSPLVTAADIANLPLPADSVDIAVSCLALMGTNWPDFVDEAWRILRHRGEFWVAEIKSRFGRVSSKGNSGGNSKGKGPRGRVEHSVGNRRKGHQGRGDGEDDSAELAVEVDGAMPTGQETDVSAFVKVMGRRGFNLDMNPDGKQAIDVSNRMFVTMRFLKSGTPEKGKNVKPGERDGDEDDEEGADEDDGAVLKPCVYKLR